MTTAPLGPVLVLSGAHGNAPRWYIAVQCRNGSDRSNELTAGHRCLSWESNSPTPQPLTSAKPLETSSPYPGFRAGVFSPA